MRNAIYGPALLYLIIVTIVSFHSFLTEHGIEAGSPRKIVGQMADISDKDVSTAIKNEVLPTQRDISYQKAS